MALEASPLWNCVHRQRELDQLLSRTSAAEPACIFD